MTSTLADRVRAAQAPSAALNRAIDAIHAGDLPAAVLAMREALDEPGASVETWYWAGLLCHQMRDYDGARRMLESVLEHWPDFGPALYNAGVAWECRGNYSAAASRYRSAIRQWGETSAAVPPLVNLGGCLYRMGKPGEAGDAHLMALCVDAKGDDEALTARSAVRLLNGDFELGFREYESRRALGQFRAANWRPSWGADWDGRATKSSVMLYHEQGAGDTIQMLRYAHTAATMSGVPVTLCVQPELVRLARRLRDNGAVQAVVTRDEVALRARKPHWHAPLMSLPYLTGIAGAESIPAAPYLHSHARPSAKPFTVGLCWKGNPQHNNDRDRSAPTFDVLRPLFEAAPHVRWVSLQHGAPFPHGEPLKAADFAETADIVAGCDLVITVDSAVAHVAGALGVQTWCMVPTAPEWRWSLRDTTPWYPSVRVWRRRSTAEWPEMIRRIADELGRMA